MATRLRVHPLSRRSPHARLCPHQARLLEANVSGVHHRVFGDGTWCARFDALSSSRIPLVAELPRLSFPSVFVSANVSLMLSVPPETAGVAGGVFNSSLRSSFPPSISVFRSLSSLFSTLSQNSASPFASASQTPSRASRPLSLDAFLRPPSDRLPGFRAFLSLSHSVAYPISKGSFIPSSLGYKNAFFFTCAVMLTCALLSGVFFIDPVETIMEPDETQKEEMIAEEEKKKGLPTAKAIREE